MSRLSLILGCLVLLLAACDRPEGAPAQPGAEEGAASVPGGKVDRIHAGTAIPEFVVADPEGKTLNLAAQDGPVLLNLWATWCAPCVKEMPQLDALAGEFEGEVKVITVSQDIRGAEAVTPFFAKGGYKRLEPWLDADAALSGQFTPEGALPLTILFDASGKEVLRVAGGYDWGSPEAAKLIREGLAAK